MLRGGWVVGWCNRDYIAAHKVACKDVSRETRISWAVIYSWLKQDYKGGSIEKVDEVMATWLDARRAGRYIISYHIIDYSACNTLG